MQPSYVTFSVCGRTYVFELDKISASDWLRRQFLAVGLASQSEVACICTLSALYHMAKQQSKGVSICRDILYSTTTFCAVLVYFKSLRNSPLL